MGFDDSNLCANFMGEWEDSNLKAKDSNLCSQVKRTQNCSGSPKFGQFFANIWEFGACFRYIRTVFWWLWLRDKSFFDFWDYDSNANSCESFQKSLKDTLGLVLGTNPYPTESEGFGWAKDPNSQDLIRIQSNCHFFLQNWCKKPIFFGKSEAKNLIN
jgi:hypothetical protein